MNDSPPLLIVPVVLVIGVVTYWQFGTQKPLDSINTENRQSEESVVDESGTATNSPLEKIQIHPGLSSDEKLSPQESEVRFRDREKVSWLRRNLVMEEPCDFDEIEVYVNTLLAKPEWETIVTKYPNRKYLKHQGDSMDAIVATRSLHTCYLEVILETDEITKHEEYNQFKFFDIWNLLPLINDGEDYSSVSVEFKLGEIPFGMLLAESFSETSYGTYQYDATSKLVRLFRVSSGRGGKITYYEADRTGEETCPCNGEIRFWITNKFSEADVKRALEKGVLAKSFEF